MIPTAVKTYLTLASGLTEVTKARAVTAAKALVANKGATVDQISALAEDLLTTSRGNRTALALLVRSEVDRALGRLGLATAEEVSRLTDRLKAAEARLRELDARTTPKPPAVSATARRASAPKALPGKTTGGEA